MLINLYDADYYCHEERLGAEWWLDEPETHRTKALKQATRMINLLNFIGCKTDPAQENEFPRGGDTTIPRDIEIACVEIALALLDGRDVEIEADNEIQAAGLATGTVRRNPEMINEARANNIPSIVAWRHLRPYLQRADTVRFSRVN